MDRSNHNLSGFRDNSIGETVDKPGIFVTLAAQGTYYSERSAKDHQLKKSDSEKFIQDLNLKSKQLSHVTWFGVYPLIIFTILLFYNSFNTRQIVEQPGTDSTKVEITNYDGLNIRHLPNAKSSILRSARYGETFPLLDSTNGKWLKIALHDSVGYVNGAFSTIRHHHTDAVIENSTYLSNAQLPYHCAGGILFFIFLIAWLRKIDRRQMEIAIFYEIDENLRPLYENFKKFFSEFAGAAKIWQHTGTQANLNLKSSGGAANLIHRYNIHFINGHKTPLEFFKTNVQIPAIQLQNSELFFLPERLLIKRDKSYTAVFYKNLKITAQTGRFIENEIVPRDAQAVDRTWQHMNKKGGPDRRFANNKQLSICAYSDYCFSSNTGLNVVISTSKKGAADNFANLLLQIGRLQQQTDVRLPVQPAQNKPAKKAPVEAKVDPIIITPPPSPDTTRFEPSKGNETIVEVTPTSAPIEISEIVASVAAAKIALSVQSPADLPEKPVVIDAAPFEPLKEDQTTNVIDIVPGDIKLNLDISVGFTTPTNFTSTTNHVYQGYNPDDYKLGSKYKSKLNLSPQEVIWLNKFIHYTNAFNGIEGCSIAVIKLYLTIIKKMVRRFANEPIGLQQRLEDIKNAAYKFSLHQPNQWGYYDHSQVKEATEADLYYTVYKKAESALREAWASGRSISPAFNARSPEALELFKRYIEPVLDEVIVELLPSMPAPDEITEIELNQKNSTRWKHQFERTMSDTNRDAKTIVKEIHSLAKLNKKNPSVENIYFEAAKLMAPIDKIEALGMYLYYVKFDQKSARIDNKPLNKTNQKQLFKTPEQQAEFQAIVDELIVFKDIKQSLKKVAGFYEPKRKTITLDNSAIKMAGQELSGTISVLNKYLNEEDEPEAALEEESMTVVAIAAPADTLVTTELNVLQQTLLDLFRSNDFTLSVGSVSQFAQQHGAFKNQLIESINEACIDLLDDVLIEESEDEYTIDPDYFKKIYAE
ncbi:SH3 domain-containing protein [Mucilaginibacter sp. HC2]|uniref:tellurite resistance TerB C-terminal domain-containing protein n=1 Tax=Mucilaginibacter inviolabilis TaxID=2714892 RepID=UPI001409A2B1|nr:tellurite resistance TerB C-terminal domain-containing protein [Mucilaginibacter inviolabilis]NHA03456.1 SH3 domain-containing protein [Mucilaginibacter inviolabilis]